MEHQALYVEREGAWHLEVENEGMTNVQSAMTNNPHPGPLPSDGRGKEKPREQRTLREEMEAHEARVEEMRVECDVRQFARKHGASVKALEDLVQRARIAFRIVDGRAVPVAADGRSVLRSADGSRVLTVEEWTQAQMEKAGDGFARRGADAACEDAAMPLRNPFTKRFWNLTEQMRLRKADPEFAARLKAQAWQEA